MKRSVRLPLFPLNTVLFPGALLPLHVFEQRYRVLVSRCLEGNRPFGVALIRSGDEVGAAADPHRVGTTARIVFAEPLPDGRFFLVARGEQRFAIEALIAPGEDPYLVAEARELDDAEGAGAARLARDVAGRLDDYLLARGHVVPERPATPIELAYAVAAALDGLDPPERQRLLELPTAAARLEAELPLLERATALAIEALTRERSGKLN